MAGHDDLYREEILKAAQQANVNKKDVVERLLKKINETRFFKDSKPAIDFEFVEHLVKTYGEKELRQELNKMYVWLLADPRRRKKNYRRFIVNWLNNKDKRFYVEWRRGDY
ncbi:hypothetical protein Calab_1512 [Caldithrix abyssi DSM 13497]|nr:hypothetical protein [Caldithrix abyssi]EHO40386.1 hypothetical protein Calab_0747 [Caldithrix abyssi DSM 13497]EHO41132.1 hypothetical protein Calab_1512 [Caldithrix abyssi DSM 13497]